MKDILGKALIDYHSGKYSEDIITWTNISDEDELPLPYLFRGYSDMPQLEQQALQLTKGKVLDVGCGAGNHSLWLQGKNIEVKAIDTSEGAIEVAKKRGVNKAEVKSLLDETDSFDTILLLMNGTGIFQELSQVSNYLKHLKGILKTDGQILIDSSDIAYMYDGDFESEDDKRYYGELDYFLSYKDEKEVPLKWLYLDFKTLKTACLTVGLTCEKVVNGEHFDYLARIKL
ncbi:class I SAM-dependent methyltransferase [Winogradskyella ursingii]|uniref:class I SAM-dependent methyltransferase n=1 Tax=Winogradskyella ursingii TaxID=2686079 RepID=UPI0015C84409|nr:class I SAM-dependent methyltransferase [Winogradskyella ursingii]